MKCEIANKFLAVRNGVRSERNFAVKLQVEGRQLGVDPESATLFAMKYAIGEIFSSESAWNGLAPGLVYAFSHSRKRQGS